MLAEAVKVRPSLRIEVGPCHVNHPDHRAVGDLVPLPSAAASTRLYDETLEGLQPWYVAERCG